ncbi:MULTISPECIES: helix-turn-helix domain-containing protein [Chryseobacterium]|uniref:helix-turn-helix domain-containing protein n=1 Tax=Chryseobacterium TaxID=59732 RepID=UPI00195E4C15|nr:MULTISPECIES: helix-turn-helix domain-containing protein [Chryseobacterium]MBM7421068.1 excisionase family DNA binding protein [Chryseobacterium sp. JUb44]MDH6211026.1 excisionase family DNA binding protein [Chryseobacterium sp. BIGb0186]WSO09691.1 helix-turn-helix domain-containing protein [Chryseobacterium scophthalmum]
MVNKFETLQREEDRYLFERRMLTTKEAAFYLGLSVRTVRGKAAKGILTSYRPWGKNLYFEISELDEYLFSKKRSSVEKSSEKASMLNFKISKGWKI